MIAISENLQATSSGASTSRGFKSFVIRIQGFFDKMMTTPPGGEHLISNAGAGKEVRKLITKQFQNISDLKDMCLFHGCFTGVSKKYSKIAVCLTKESQILKKCIWSLVLGWTWSRHLMVGPHASASRWHLTEILTWVVLATRRRRRAACNLGIAGFNSPCMAYWISFYINYIQLLCQVFLLMRINFFPRKLSTPKLISIKWVQRIEVYSPLKDQWVRHQLAKDPKRSKLLYPVGFISSVKMGATPGLVWCILSRCQLGPYHWHKQPGSWDVLIQMNRLLLRESLRWE